MKRLPLAFAAWFAVTTVAWAQEPFATTTPASTEVAAPAAAATPPPPSEPPAAVAPTTPPPSRTRPVSNTDEAGLWGLADRAEQQARASGELERDPALNAYIHDVCGRVADGVGDRLVELGLVDALRRAWRAGAERQGRQAQGGEAAHQAACLMMLPSSTYSTLESTCING